MKSRRPHEDVPDGLARQGCANRYLEAVATIIVNLDVVLAKRKMRLSDLSEAVGVSVQNLSILKTGKAKAIRFSTLGAICRALECQPSDILEYRPDETESEGSDSE